MPQKFGRKPRAGRGASLKAATRRERVYESLKDRSVLLRLGIGALGIIGFLFAVQGWKPLFPYRVGDRLERGAVARIDFKEVNQAETDRARRESEARVPYVFRRDLQPLNPIPSRLRTHLGAVAEANSINDLSPEVREAFRLTQQVVVNDKSTDAGSDGEGVVETQKPVSEIIPDASAPAEAGKTPDEDADIEAPGASAVPENSDRQAPSQVTVTRFEQLKRAMAGDEAVGERLDQIQRDFELFLEPVRELGLLDLSELERDEAFGAEISLDQAIEIAPDGPDDEAVSATIADVVLAETMKDTGRLGTKWISFPRLSAIRDVLEDWMASQLPTTLRYSSEQTQEKRRIARETAGERYNSYSDGQVLVDAGTVLNAEQLRLLKLEYEAVGNETPLINRFVRGLTAFLMFTVLAVLFGEYLFRSEPEMARSPTQLAVFLTLCVATVWLARVVSVDPWRAEIIPLLAAVMILAIAYDQVLATLCAFVLSVVISLATVATLEHFMVLMIVSVVSIVPLSGVSSRSSLIKTGFMVAIVYFAVSWAAGVIGQREDVHWADWGLVMHSLRGAGWCLVCCYLVSGTLPFIESRFGIVTDISLLELSDISHPLLQELVRRAPGTYNHSIAVATIGEAAAEAIGANGLLLRVGAYFHDIGKMLKPEYFIENNTAGNGNRHDTLAPAMSTLIIIGHVKDGVELANEHNLPKPIIDFIEQHHGTTLVEYFFHEATRQADEDHKSEAEEASFRYPGPKPQTKEAGIMMLTDAVESASRTLSEPTPKRIENLVHDITMKRLHDGQFDDCNLTIAEIHTVEDTLTKSLIAIYHGRVKYPESATTV